MTTTHRAEADAVREIVQAAAHDTKIITLEDGRIFAAVPNGNFGQVRLDNLTQPHTLEPPIPTYVRQGLTLQDERSLIAYANSFKQSSSLLFANVENNHIVAVIDYHCPGDSGAEPNAALLAHRAGLNMPYSEEWLAWSGIDSRLMPQLEFVRFLEENATEVADPDAASLIEVCRDLQGLRKVNFTSVVRTASANAERIEYIDETKAGTRGGVDIPHTFTLVMPVYFNGAIHTIAARLRWHLDDGALKLGIKLVRPETVRQNAFRSVVDRIGVLTGLDVLYGSV